MTTPALSIIPIGGGPAGTIASILPVVPAKLADPVVVDVTPMDDKFQDKVLACMLGVTEFNAVACQHVKPKYFEGDINHNIAKCAIDFYGDYGTCVTGYAFIEIMKRKFSKDPDNLVIHLNAFAEIRKLAVSDADFILDRLIEFIKIRRWKLLIADAVERHLGGDGREPDIEKLESEAMQIANITKIKVAEPYDYFDDDNIRERALARVEALTLRPGISTGIPELDRRLNGGGWMPKELYMIIAPAKRGKTQMLLWAVLAAALQGKKVVHFTCEVSRHICCDRMDSNTSGVPFDALARKSDDVARAVLATMPEGQIKVIEYPTKTLTVPMMEEHLKKLERFQGFKADLVSMDYLDIGKSTIKDTDDLKCQKDIAERLRGLAGKFECPVLTASQINRSGKGKSVNDGGDIAGSYDKVAIADQIIALSATDDELRNNELKIVLAESRNTKSGIIKIKTAFDRGRFFEKVLGVD